VKENSGDGSHKDKRIIWSSFTNIWQFWRVYPIIQTSSASSSWSSFGCDVNSGFDSLAFAI